VKDIENAKNFLYLSVELPFFVFGYETSVPSTISFNYPFSLTAFDCEMRWSVLVRAVNAVNNTPLPKTHEVFALFRN
jgi:hypothetical protein